MVVAQAEVPAVPAREVVPGVLAREVVPAADPLDPPGELRVTLPGPAAVPRPPEQWVPTARRIQAQPMALTPGRTQTPARVLAIMESMGIPTATPTPMET